MMCQYITGIKKSSNCSEKNPDFSG